ISNRLSDYLRFGMYPGIIDQTETAKKRLLDELGSDYLFKDVLSTETLRKPDFLRQLLKALALQIGSEVSFRELSNLLGTSVETIQRYVQLLEHSFVIFRLSSYSRNLRSEIGRGNKFFFYDLGIRNSLLQNYSPLEGRTDAGALWENFCIVERMKLIQYEQKNVNLYFWRTKTQKEIDFIEESDGKLAAFEFKLKPGEAKAPKDFSDAYPYTTFNTIHPKNFFQFLRRSTTSPLPE
ncbi:MAG: DUF4143 domain-containing protein, partial [Cyclobacteriaceae bacterium]|nr:DUF4143 domain-containing protein [Cyclobacteriaceae bacterium]